MNKNTVAEALRALATSDKSRSDTARLRDVFDDVEIALKAGVSRAAILETLHTQGFVMTAKSFESAIYRLRKKRGSSKATPDVTPPEPVTPAINAPPPVLPTIEVKTGQNPLRALSGTPRDGNHIPKTNFEVE
jgi:hypothetical protein